MAKHGMMINGRYVPAWKFEARRGQEHFGVAEREYRAMVALVDAIGAKFAEVARDRNLSDVGKRQAMRDWTAGAAAPLFKNARAASKGARDRATSKRSELLPAKRAKDDVAGAVLASEIRKHWQNMDPAKRTARIMMGELSPDEMLALIELPAEYSGISNEQRGKIVERATLAASPDAAQDITDLGEAADAVDDALRAAMLTLQKAGIRPTEMAQLLGEPTLQDFIGGLVSPDDPDSARDGAADCSPA